MILKLSWQNGLVYRFSLFMWRLRQFLSTLMSLSLWTVLFSSQATAFGYTQPEMLTYIFVVSVLQSMILATVLHGLTDLVYSGNLSQILLKPVHIFMYLASQEAADKAKNFVFIVIEAVILFAIFQPTVVVPPVQTLLLFGLWTIGGVVLNFCISLLFGAIGFWSPDSWSGRFLFFMILNFTAGSLFPLNILPQSVQNVLFATPFPYLSFIQTQLFLQKLTPAEIGMHGIGLLIWILLLGGIAKATWAKGLKDYSSAGQ